MPDLVSCGRHGSVAGIVSCLHVYHGSAAEETIKIDESARRIICPACFRTARHHCGRCLMEQLRKFYPSLYQRVSGW